MCLRKQADCYPNTQTRRSNKTEKKFKMMMQQVYLRGNYIRVFFVPTFKIFDISNHGIFNKTISNLNASYPISSSFRCLGKHNNSDKCVYYRVHTDIRNSSLIKFPIILFTRMRKTNTRKPGKANARTRNPNADLLLNATN